MHITITGFRHPEERLTPEQVSEVDIIPLCEQFRLHGFTITEIKAEGLSS